MKTWKKGMILALSAVLTMGATACSGGEQGEEPANYVDPNTVISTYDNRAYNEYLMGAEGKEAAIKNQWPGYGIGDPFILRHNGMYYLYVSSLDTEIGVRGYKSADLVNWVPMTGTGLKEGFVSQDNVSLAAYAPEVLYYNGTFYMYTSSGGAGHYVLTAQAPEGPFVRATDNMGSNIDGSVFLDDDEQLYWLSSGGGGNSGILMSRMDGPLDVKSGTKLGGVSMGGWTEGPFVIKRDGVYYLTYTGNHVTADSYRISYATETELPDNLRNAFTAAFNNPVALETETALKGIGHSSTVMGPDMDSHYLAYHYLNSSGGPNRSLGIDRLTFSGKMMSVSPTLTGSVTPQLPAFYAMGTDAEKFTTAGGTLLSTASAAANFTVEYNLTGASGAKYVFGYEDEKNYFSVNLDLAAKKLELTQTEGGKAKTLASSTLAKEYSAQALHSVRVAARDGKLDVSFDNMTKIDNAEVEVPAGKVGYMGLAEGVQVGYTAFSNVAMGMSDEQEAKQATGFVGAQNYLRDNTYTMSPKLSGGSGLSLITEEEDYRLMDWAQLTLDREGDQVSYLLYNKDAGRYALELVYPKADGGKQIGVKVDGVKGGTVYRCTLPRVQTEDNYVKAIVGEFELEKGARILRLENVGEEVRFAAFRFVEASAQTPQFSAPLSGYVEKGADYKTIWKLKEGGHYAKAGTRQLVYFGDNTISDFTLEVKIMLEGATNSNTAGIVFRAQNYSASIHDSANSMQGYYLSIQNDGIRLSKLDYENTNDGLYSDARMKFDSDKFYTLKVQCIGNTITIWVDGQQVASVTESWGFANGKIGLYTNGAAAVYKDLTIGA